MKLDLGVWATLRGARPFEVAGDVPRYASISFGRTSAMMAALCDPSIPLTFQNTGREHPRTYDFGARLEDALQRPIVWLEWRPPPRKGDAPRKFGFAVVDYKTAARRGEPFREMLQALADYRREVKGLGPVAPWARSRLCTAYLKHRVKFAWLESLGIECFESLVGLRADEPDRVRRLGQAERGKKYQCAPLYEAGIVKSDVLAFWRRQSFDLELEEHQGNCTGCFLKDEADKARVLGEPETDAEWWIAMQRDFPGFGGQRPPSYAQLLGERNERLAIERAIREGEIPINGGAMTPHRFRLVVRQEERRIVEGAKRVACACEQTSSMADGDVDVLALEAS